MKQKASFAWLFIPLAIYVALMAILFVERTGVAYTVEKPAYRYLEAKDQPVPSGYTEPPVEALVLYDSWYPSEQKLDQAARDTLDSMRVRYDRMDISGDAQISFEKYKTVVLDFNDYYHFKQLHELVDWVERGGRVLIAIRPSLTDNFYSVYRKMGIRSIEDRAIQVLGLAFTSDLFPGAQGMRLEGTQHFLSNNSYPVQLDNDAVIHITSADEYNLPLLWEKNYGNGRFVVANSDQFTNTDTRGILGAAYSRLQDVFVYPVINSSVYFIDDFPAPIKEGQNQVITQEFNRTIHDFYINIWWPDMQALADKYGLKYTGLLIETYNNKTVPPFNQDISMDDHRYLGRVLLKMGGEIGLHGYNHVPLCLKEDQVNKELGYPDWPSVHNEMMALQALDEVGHSIFPGKTFDVYVPPSNILCPGARKALPQALPDLKVVSSLLVKDYGEGDGNYFQNFEEAPDGIIEFPRIVSGYYLYENGQLALINELVLHYVNSHFIHPDDILDPIRRDNRDWKTMRSQLEQQVRWLKEYAPGLRAMTVQEGAKATQRFYRLKVNAGFEGEAYAIHLGNFYDEASLMMRTSREPVHITGGKITKVNSSLYLITADQPDILVEFRKETQ